MKTTAFAAAFCCLVLCQSGEEKKPITPAEAVRQLGKPGLLVEMTVRSAKDRMEMRGVIYLDSEDDFTHPDNLGVAISADALELFKKQGTPDPAEHFRGKTIRVKGCVMKLEDRPYLPVLHPDQIVLVKKPAP